MMGLFGGYRGGLGPTIIRRGRGRGITIRGSELERTRLFRVGGEEDFCNFYGFFLTGLVFPLLYRFDSGTCQQCVSADQARLCDEAIGGDGDFDFYFS